MAEIITATFCLHFVVSDVHGLASGQKPIQAMPHRPSQAKPKALTWSWLWCDLNFLKAKAKGSGHGLEHSILEQLPPIIVTLMVAQQALKIQIPHVSNCS